MSELTPDQPSIPASVELAMRRTGMAFQRTRMAADRTLMSEIRTALSLITFGFTIYQLFKKLADAHLVSSSTGFARHFGISLVLLGILMLVFGIIYHVIFMLGLREDRARMKQQGLIFAHSKYPVSLTLIVAVLLLLIGIGAAVTIA